MTEYKSASTVLTHILYYDFLHPIFIPLLLASFAGLGYLTFYLAGKLHIFDKKGHTYKSLLTTLPLIGAALIAISRTQDYRHHWQDITVGGLIGTQKVECVGEWE